MHWLFSFVNNIRAAVSYVFGFCYISDFLSFLLFQLIDVLSLTQNSCIILLYVLY